MSYPRSSRFAAKKSVDGADVFKYLLLGLAAIPLLALVVFVVVAAASLIVSLVMLAAVNWGLVTLGGVLGFSVHTVGFWGAFKLGFLSTILAGALGGTRAATSNKS